MTTGTSWLRPTHAAALAEWRELVVASAAQVQRLREESEDGDFYSTRVEVFRAGGQPAELEPLVALSQPGDTWLDVGAGAGRHTIPLASRVKHVIAVEPSAAMRTALATTAAEANLRNVEVVDLRWPPAEERDVPVADVVLAANVLYDIEDLDRFLTALERHTRRRCVVILGDQSPSSMLADVWPTVHGEPQATLPALREFLAVLSARGRRFDLSTISPTGVTPIPLGTAAAIARQLCWVREGSDKDRRLIAALDERFVRDGGNVVPPPPVGFRGIVSWEPTIERPAQQRSSTK